jgi:hypothetical protein
MRKTLGVAFVCVCGRGVVVGGAVREGTQRTVHVVKLLHAAGSVLGKGVSKDAVVQKVEDGTGEVDAGDCKREPLVPAHSTEQSHRILCAWGGGAREDEEGKQMSV